MAFQIVIVYYKLARLEFLVVYEIVVENLEGRGSQPIFGISSTGLKKFFLVRARLQNNSQ
jgi:hypothetical protein